MTSEIQYVFLRNMSSVREIGEPGNFPPNECSVQWSGVVFGGWWYLDADRAPVPLRLVGDRFGFLLRFFEVTHHVSI